MTLSGPKVIKALTSDRSAYQHQWARELLARLVWNLPCTRHACCVTVCRAYRVGPRFFITVIAADKKRQEGGRPIVSSLCLLIDLSIDMIDEGCASS